jgi:hypothetical protein
MIKIYHMMLLRLQYQQYEDIKTDTTIKKYHVMLLQ